MTEEVSIESGWQYADTDETSSFLSGEGVKRSDTPPTCIDLRSVFPTSFRYSLRKAWLSISMCLGACLLYYAAYGKGGVFSIPTFDKDPMHYGEFLVVRVHILFMLGELLYWEVQRRSVRYFLYGKRLHVRRGLVRHLESSAGLAPATEIFISQSTKDTVFGIYSVFVCTPLVVNSSLPKFTQIEGLTRRGAEGLRDYLFSIVEDGG